jgi:outer membrane protein TolC
LNARACLLLCLLCGGCTLGPDYRRPDPPPVDRYTATETPSHVGSSRIDPGVPIAEGWWKAFGSPALDALVARALANSPTLAQARGRLVEAQELQTARSNAARLPSVDGYLGVERQRIDPATVGFPQAPNPGPFTVYSIGANVAYTFDLFGGTRRELEGLLHDEFGIDHTTLQVDHADDGRLVEMGRFG